MDKKKILIVEDDADTRRGLNLRLRAANYETFFAVDALMAITVAKKEMPDLILLDLGMPAGDGFVIMDRLHNLASTSCIPIIIVSARDPQENRPRAMAAGADEYLQKPVNNGDLMFAIRHALGEPAFG